MTRSGGLKPVLKGLAMLAVFGGLVAGARLLGLEQHLTDRQWFLAQVQGQGAAGVLFFLWATVLITGLGLPRQIPGFLGGLVFGWFWGAALSTLGAGLGAAATFLLARTLGREFVLARFGRRVARLNDFLRAEPFRSTLAIRLFPVGHNLTTNLLAGVSDIPALPFLLGSCVGFLPQQLVFALFGAGLNAESGLGRALSLGLSVVLLAAAAWLGISMYRAYRRRGAVPVDGDETPDGEEE